MASFDTGYGDEDNAAEIAVQNGMFAQLMRAAVAGNRFYAVDRRRKVDAVDTICWKGLSV